MNQVCCLVQEAELYALECTSILAEGKTVNIYPESKYAFRVAHDSVMLWKQRNFFFLLSKAERLKKKRNSDYVITLLDSIRQPQTQAIINVTSHSKKIMEESKRNPLANSAAKATVPAIQL